MSTCKHCGAPLGEKDTVCSYCGSAVAAASNLFEEEGKFFSDSSNSYGSTFVNPGNNNYEENQSDRRSIVLNIIGFLFPVIGLILYLRFRRSRPALAESLKMWVILGFLKDAIGTVLDAPYNKISTLRFFIDRLGY